MEEIKLYHKVWAMLPVLLVLLALTIVFIIPLSQGKGSLVWNWSLLLFSGSAFLFFLFLILRERLLHKPPLIITEDKVIDNNVGRIKEYHFTDIHHFDLIVYPGLYVSRAVIRIHYMPCVETKKMSEAKGMDRIGRKINRIIMGAEDCIQVANLTMKPEKLCNLLNKRLKK